MPPATNNVGDMRHLYMCMYVYVKVFIYVCGVARLFICMRIYVHVCVLCILYIYRYMYIFMHVFFIYVYMSYICGYANLSSTENEPIGQSSTASYQHNNRDIAPGSLKNYFKLADGLP